DLDKLNTIDLVYRQYGEELNKLGITLCHIDMFTKLYTVMLVRNEDYPVFKQYADNIDECVGKHYTEKWL
ncbi:MAG: hypothetical protein CSA83_02785, partial [Actinomycetales bacterium]